MLFRSTPIAEFLDSLDIFIHYPHEGYIEEFGRAVLEAMAAGKPVILPGQFRETFGEAALYAEPEELAAMLNDLWSDKEAYLTRARIGREFVFSRSDLATFGARYEKALDYKYSRSEGVAEAPGF